METFINFIDQYPLLCTIVIVVAAVTAATLVTNKYSVILIISFLLISIPVLIHHGYKHQILKENGMFTKAVIYEFTNTKCGKSGRCIKLHYNYFVDSIEYKGAGDWYPNSDIFSVGDTILIKYNKKKPSQSQSIRDINNSWWN
jgi:hypothetical protein